MLFKAFDGDEKLILKDILNFDQVKLKNIYAVLVKIYTSESFLYKICNKCLRSGVLDRSMKNLLPFYAVLQEFFYTNLQ